MKDQINATSDIHFHPIGIIHTPFEDKAGMPIQPKGAKGIKGQIELFPEYVEGLCDLCEISHIILIYHLHKIQEPKLKVVPFLDHQERGIFATRSPSRPNPIGLSIVELKGIEDNILQIERIDVLNQTPLLDIKPYIPEFDKAEPVHTGWYEQYRGEVETKRSDDRFR